jgi:hypothetical protein
MTSEIAEKQDTTPKAAPPSLTESFVEQGLYLRNWSPRTVRSYRQAFRECPAELSKASLNAMVVALRQRGLSAGGINVRTRGHRPTCEPAGKRRDTLKLVIAETTNPGFIHRDGPGFCVSGRSQPKNQSGVGRSMRSI